jgi:hypothetical protein
MCSPSFSQCECVTDAGYTTKIQAWLWIGGTGAIDGPPKRSLPGSCCHAGLAAGVARPRAEHLRARPCVFVEELGQQSRQLAAAAVERVAVAVCRRQVSAHMGQGRLGQEGVVVQECQ